MGVFDFLKKKKDDDLGDLGGDLGGEFGAEPAFPGASGPGTPGMQGLPSERQPLFTDQPAPPPPSGIQPVPMQMSQPAQSGNMDLFASRIELVSSKIDSLKASIDRLNEKFDYLERLITAGGGRRYG